MIGRSISTVIDQGQADKSSKNSDEVTQGDTNHPNSIKSAGGKA